MSKSKQKPARTKGSPKAVPQNLALMVDSIGVVGTTEHGEHVGMELKFESGENATVLFPTAYYQKLMSALMAAGAAAHSQRLAWLGSQQAVLDYTGVEPFAPTDWAFGRAKMRDGIDVLTVRLMKDSLPVVDAALALDAAEKFSAELAAELEKGPPVARQMH